jgi:hypothetical protein
MQADSFSRKGAGPMKERLQQLLSEAGESFDYLKSDIRNLSRYMAELEELIESYRAFAATATLSAPADRATQRKLLKRRLSILPGEIEEKLNRKLVLR